MVKLGIEIEMAYNPSKLRTLRIGEYHSGYNNLGLRGWKLERDGSLRPTFQNENSYTNTVECVSKLSLSMSGMKKKLRNFKDFFSDNGRYELNEVIQFNESMGSHIHIGLTKYRFYDKGIYPIFEKTRLKFFDMLEKSDIPSKTDIKNHYGRGYAKLCHYSYKHNWKEHERNQEFNFYSETDNRGLEWRSPNLLNIETWTDFFKMWDIYLECVQFLVNSVKKWRIENRIKPKIQIKVSSEETLKIKSVKMDFEDVINPNPYDINTVSQYLSVEECNTILSNVIGENVNDVSLPYPCDTYYYDDLPDIQDRPYNWVAYDENDNIISGSFMLVRR